MAKYPINFENTTYSRLWNSKEGPALLVQLLNDPELIRANFNFWEGKFDVDRNATPTDSEGVAAFRTQLRNIDNAVLMDWRAPLGDAYQKENKGESAYTGTIPDFIARGTVEKATERNYREEKFRENFGTDASLVLEYAKEVQWKVDSANQTLSHLAAMVLSTGASAYSQGLGITGDINANPIPAGNFLTAGTTVWSDANCKLLDQMRDKETAMREKLGGTTAPFIWEIPYDIFHNVVLKNAQVLEWIKNFRTVNFKPWLNDATSATEEQFREAIAQFEGISPIVVVAETQINGGVTSTSTVHGWATNKVVFRPAGKAGLIKWTNPQDEKLYGKYGASDITRVFARGRGGLWTVMNTTLNNGNLKEWHIDLMMSAVPTLTEWLYHFIIDTATADS